MKQTIKLASLLLLVALLGACVENNESPSVTAVRNAKAEQLKGLAALYNAQAAAEQVIANAEAALKAAEAKAKEAHAAYKAAEAKLKEMQAEEQNIKNQSDLQKLEIEKEEAKAKLAEIAQDMKTQEHKAASELADAQLLVKESQKLLLAHDKELADEEKEALDKLVKSYGDRLTALTTKKNDIHELQVQLVRYENGLVSLNEATDEQIAANEEQIALNEAKIAVYKQYEAYQAPEDAEALEAERTKLETAAEIAQQNTLNSLKIYNSIDPEFDETEAKKAITNDPFYKFITTGQIILKGEEDEDDYTYDFWYYDSNISQYVYYQRPSFTSTLSYGYVFHPTAEVDGKEVALTAYGDSIDIYFKENDGQSYYYDDYRTFELERNKELKQFESDLVYWDAQLDSLEKAYKSYDGVKKILPETDDNGNFIYDAAGKIKLSDKPILSITDSTAWAHNEYNKAVAAKAAAKTLAAIDAAQANIDKYEPLFKTLSAKEIAVEQSIENFEFQVKYLNNQINGMTAALAYCKDFEKELAALQEKVEAYNDAQVTAYAEKVAAQAKVKQDEFTETEAEAALDAFDARWGSNPQSGEYQNVGYPNGNYIYTWSMTYVGPGNGSYNRIGEQGYSEGPTYGYQYRYENVGPGNGSYINAMVYMEVGQGLGQFIHVPNASQHIGHDALADMIVALEDANEELAKKNEELVETLEAGGIKAQEKLIADQKQKIADEQLVLKAMENAFNIAKAELNAVLPSEAE
jgi:hypothetical protein